MKKRLQEMYQKFMKIKQTNFNQSYRISDGIYKDFEDMLLEQLVNQNEEGNLEDYLIRSQKNIKRRKTHSQLTANDIYYLVNASLIGLEKNYKSSSHLNEKSLLSFETLICSFIEDHYEENKSVQLFNIKKQQMLAFLFLNNKTQFEFIVSNYPKFYEMIYNFIKKQILEQNINQYNNYYLSQNFLENQYLLKKKRGRRPKQNSDSKYGDFMAIEQTGQQQLVQKPHSQLVDYSFYTTPQKLKDNNQAQEKLQQKNLLNNIMIVSNNKEIYQYDISPVSNLNQQIPSDDNIQQEKKEVNLNKVFTSPGRFMIEITPQKQQSVGKFLNQNSYKKQFSIEKINLMNHTE